MFSVTSQRHLALYIVSSCLLLTAINLHAQKQQRTDSLTQILPELVIKAKKVVSKGDKVRLYLSKDNRDFGTNAVTAISSLDRFSISLSDLNLKSYDKKDVFVVINGVPSTIDMLRSYRAEDIKYVEYYDVTPAKYMAFTSGPVVDVIIKKRRDYIVSAQLISVETLNSLFSNNNINLTYADSLNMLKLNTKLTFDNDPHIISSSIFDYSDGNSTLFKGNHQKSKTQRQEVELSYQRNQGKHLIDTKIRFHHRKDENNEPSNITLNQDQMSYNGARNNKLSSSLKFIDGSAYYDYSFTERRKLAFMLAGSYSEDNNQQSLSAELPSPYEFLGYDLKSKYRSHEGAMAALGSFITHISNVDISINGRYTYINSKLSDLINGNKSDYTKHSSEFYIDANWTKGILNISPKVGYSLISNEYSGNKHSTYTPTALLVAKISGANNLLGSFAQISIGISQNNPPISDSEDKLNYIDRNFLEKGNPSLNSFLTYNTGARLFYAFPSQKGWAMLSGTYTYRHNPFVPILYKQDDFAIKSFDKISYQRDLNLMLSASWSPARMIYVQPFIENKWQRLPLPGSHIKSYCFRWGGTVLWTKGAWAVQFSAYSRNVEWNGALKSSTGNEYDGMVQWRHNAFSLAIDISHSLQNIKTEGSCEGFRYQTSVDKQRYNCRVSLIASFYISKGMTRNRNSRILETPSFE